MLRLYRYRFLFEAADALYFPPGKAGNIVRGAFGTIFRRIACVPDCEDVGRCEIRRECAYAQVFEPQSEEGEGLSGYRDWPRPFVLRASHLGSWKLERGEGFWFDLHLFDVKRPVLPYFVLAFARLMEEGLGPGRGRAWLREVRRVRVEFRAPTEIRGAKAGKAPEFGVLFARTHGRISALSAFYGDGEVGVDYRGMGERARTVRMAGGDGRHEQVSRRSSRTWERHSIGGFVGEAVYEWDLGEFMGFLRAGEWVRVGKHTVLGWEMRVHAA